MYLIFLIFSNFTDWSIGIEELHGLTPFVSSKNDACRWRLESDCESAIAYKLQTFGKKKVILASITDEGSPVAQW